ncbi:hypothetical protein BCR44DRAFT_1144316 [Catenaria anguillulae PL171]|uniref:Uncharacterized protein n=1 Tax=Catenaria anguillulae PL171 TaxID=765915 RepID=A0A1Y2HJS9_9FUNG|nr:hypothetical protein BCR44DRAFT_1144316 [Catenaria anguillulae PL171]
MSGASRSVASSQSLWRPSIRSQASGTTLMYPRHPILCRTLDFTMPHYTVNSPFTSLTMDDTSIQHLLERAIYVKQLLLEQSRLGRVPRSQRFTEGMMLTMESVGSISALTNRFTKKSTFGKYFSWRIRNQLAELEKDFESRVLLLREIAAEEQPLVENQFDSIPRRSTASFRESDRLQADQEVDLLDDSHRLDRIAPESQLTQELDNDEPAPNQHPSFGSCRLTPMANRPHRHWRKCRPTSPRPSDVHFLSLPIFSSCYYCLPLVALWLDSKS